MVMVLVEQVGHISPTAHVQALGYPFECHRCFLAQHSCCFDLLFISFWALLQPCFRPIQPPEFFVNQSIGFLLVALLAFRSVVAATSRLANGKQLLSELIIHQAPTALRSAGDQSAFPPSASPPSGSFRPPGWPKVTCPIATGWTGLRTAFA